MDFSGPENCVLIDFCLYVGIFSSIFLATSKIHLSSYQSVIGHEEKNHSLGVSAIFLRNFSRLIIPPGVVKLAIIAFPSDFTQFFTFQPIETNQLILLFAENNRKHSLSTTAFTPRIPKPLTSPHKKWSLIRWDVTSWTMHFKDTTPASSPTVKQVISTVPYMFGTSKTCRDYLIVFDVLHLY
jgi:hypothetical protein